MLESQFRKSLVDRRKKGFEAPVGEWLRGPLAPMVDDLLLGRRFRARGLFDTRAVNRLWQEHRAGSSDHRHRLWSLVMLELWFRQFVDLEAAGKAEGAAA